MPPSPISEAFGRLAGSIETLATLTPRQQEARAMLAGPQRFSCLVGGTRSGKSFAIVSDIVERAVNAPGSRHAVLRFRANAVWRSIGGDTLPAVCRRCFPGLVLEERRRDEYFALPNGSEIHLGGLDDAERVDKILGLEFASVFLNEASQIPYGSALTAWTRLAQRVPGLPQRGYVDLNPVGKSHWTNLVFGELKDPVTRRPLADPENYRRLTLNPVDNADNLDPAFLRGLSTMPERQRRRFYDGVYSDDRDDALWSYEVVDRHRCGPERIPEGDRAAVVVAVDPSGASGRNDLAADEIGIVAAARGRDGHAYVLEDLSARLSPQEWAARAVTAYHRYAADCIVAEANFGGEMVRATIQAADRNVPVRLVTASRGKAVRAEPISIRYAAGEVHHVGRLEALEDQLVAFTTGGYEGTGSPDHADAAIWALTHLLGGDSNAGIIEYYENMAREAVAETPPGFGASIEAGAAYPIRMRAPPHFCGTFMTITGRSLEVAADRTAMVDEKEAKSMRAFGWTDC